MSLSNSCSLFRVFSLVFSLEFSVPSTRGMTWKHTKKKLARKHTLTHPGADPSNQSSSLQSFVPRLFFLRLWLLSLLRLLRCPQRSCEVKRGHGRGREATSRSGGPSCCVVASLVARGTRWRRRRQHHRFSHSLPGQIVIPGMPEASRSVRRQRWHFLEVMRAGSKSRKCKEPRLKTEYLR